jgi:uncharacterized protein YvpB
MRHSKTLAMAFIALAMSACSASTGSPDNVGATEEEIISAPSSIHLDVPLILQKPELGCGCEVTALAMMLRYAGAHTDKMTLAAQVDKVPWSYSNGLHGNPNVGFVGDVRCANQPGYGVYHGPVKRLAERYLGHRVLDLTGQSFDDILRKYVGHRRPVWIISAVSNNTNFRRLNPGDFQTWHTPQGNLQVTFAEHSVLITGYDPSYVYINNPLAGKNERHDRRTFRQVWEQMGSQAISYQ